MLPSRMDVACELHVPVHRGNHAAGWAHDVDLAYPKAVMALLDEVKARLERGAFCSAPETLTRQLDAASERILRKVERFVWTLSADGLSGPPHLQRSSGASWRGAGCGSSGSSRSWRSALA